MSFSYLSLNLMTKSWLAATAVDDASSLADAAEEDEGDDDEEKEEEAEVDDDDDDDSTDGATLLASMCPATQSPREKSKLGSTCWPWGRLYMRGSNAQGVTPINAHLTALVTTGGVQGDGAPLWLQLQTTSRGRSKMSHMFTHSTSGKCDAEWKLTGASVRLSACVTAHSCRSCRMWDSTPSGGDR